MKKSTLFLIIAIVSLYIAWRTFRINKDIRDAQESITEPGTEPANPNAVPEKPVNRIRVPRINKNKYAPAVVITADQRERVVTTYDNCPYCGTPNAEIKRTYQGNTLIATDVFCNNKSCPGSYGGKIVTESKSSKFAVER